MKGARDVVFVRGLKAETTVGIYGWERKAPQPVVLDLELAARDGASWHSDEIADTLDYAVVVAEVRGLLQRSRFNLLERLAEEVAAFLMERFAAPWVRVSIRKAFAVTGAEAGVTLERVAPGLPAT